MNNIVIEPARGLVVELPLLKSHLRIAHEHEDDYLKNIIEMATDILEHKISESILEKTFRYIYYPKVDMREMIDLPYRHIIKILSVNNYNEAIPIRYRSSCDNGVWRIQADQRDFPIEILYKAGLICTPERVPCDLKFAVLQIAKNIYECSEEDVLESKYIKDIIRSYRSLNL